jgi:glycine betaine/proline transport system permease protein
MAGVNQVIMLALSMAVIAGLIGAGGLGGVVVTSISRLDVGLGFEGGISVVILAIYLDRLTASFGDRSGRSSRRRLTRRRTSPPPEATTPDQVRPASAPAVPSARA